jgi:hypothetical protein
MAGILNSKTRLFDTILTPEGRRQLAEGTLRAKFYSFTDKSTFYKRDTIVSGGLDETYRFITEASALPQDQITFETDDTGNVRALIISGSEGYSVLNGRLFSLTGSTNDKKPQITGSAFASLSEELLNGSIDAFKNQFILKSPDPLDDDEDIKFNLSANKLSYIITNESPFKKEEVSKANVRHVESFFQDARFSNVENFLFLPPVNKARIGSNVRVELGHFINVNQNEVESYDDLHNDYLKKYIDKGYETVIEFIDTSVQNNIIGQFFEVSDNIIRKLDVLEFITFDEEDSISSFSKQIFFVGKVFIDELGSETFVHLFTLIFES